MNYSWWDLAFRGWWPGRLQHFLHLYSQDLLIYIAKRISWEHLRDLGQESFWESLEVSECFAGLVKMCSFCRPGPSYMKLTCISQIITPTPTTWATEGTFGSQIFKLAFRGIFCAQIISWAHLSGNIISSPPSQNCPAARGPHICNFFYKYEVWPRVDKLQPGRKGKGIPSGRTLSRS